MERERKKGIKREGKKDRKRKERERKKGIQRE
jgi:hypothetical protein